MRSFLAALDTGSLLAASRRIAVSQPTLGRHVSELESQLGAVLFERTGRGLRPTDLALSIAAHARSMDAGALAIARTVAGRDAEPAGTVRITASQMVATQLLPPIIVQLQEREPGLQVEMVANDRISNLLRREADIAVRMVRPEQGSLIARRVASVGMGAYASVSYLKRHGEPAAAAELPRHRLIGFDTNDAILEGFVRHGVPVTREHFVVRSDDTLVAWQMMLAGAGIGILPHFLAQRTPALREVLPGLPVPSLPVWLAVHRELRSNRRIRLVFDHLAAQLPVEIEQT